MVGKGERDMINEIGEAAGAIWIALNEKGEMAMARLKSETNLATNMLNMGLGWLAREDKVQFSGSGKSLKVSLK
jgi:hypothetical protein